VAEKGFAKNSSSPEGEEWGTLSADESLKWDLDALERANRDISDDGESVFMDIVEKLKKEAEVVLA
jgi:hypothetical protein